MKKGMVILAVFLLLGVSSGIVMAYLISDDAIRNEITATDTEIKLTEDFTPPEELEPGSVINKKPKITNVSDSSCYVRMRYYFSDSQAEENCEKIQILEGWTLKEDGYYYWNKALAPQETTGALFEEIVVKSNLNKEELEGFEVLVYAEAVQSDGLTAEEAWKNMMN